MFLISIVLLNVDKMDILKQLKEQTYKNIEIVLVNHEKKEYEDIPFYTFDEFSLDLLHGQYVLFLNEEDHFLKTDAIEKMEFLAQTTRNDIIATSFLKNEKKYEPSLHLGDPDFKYYAFYIEKTLAYRCSKLYRVDFLKEHKINIKNAFEMNLEAYENKASYAYLDELLMDTKEKLIVLNNHYYTYFDCIEQIQHCKHSIKSLYKYLKVQDKTKYKQLVKDKNIHSLKLRIFMQVFALFMGYNGYIFLVILIRFYWYIKGLLKNE